MKQFFVIFAICLFNVTVYAQEERQTYALIVPTAEAFLTAVPSVLSYWESEIPSYYGKMPQPIVDAIIFELQTRYSEEEIFELPFSVLREAYATLSVSVFADNPVPSPTGWITAMLKAWLRENPTNFEGLSSLDIPGLYVEIESADFSRNEGNEYLLRLGSDSINGFLIVQANPALPEGYEVILDYWLDNLNRGGYPVEAASLGFQDITGDGLNEWMFSVGAGGPGMWSNCGNLQIYSSHNTEVINILPEGSNYCEPSGGGSFAYAETVAWEYVNRDQDAALEIQQNQLEGDNWQCNWINTTFFDWNGEIYTSADSSVVEEETLGCAIRNAEPYLWENNVEAAIPLYEAGLENGWISEPTDYQIESRAEIEQYTRTRLMIAYALAGRIEDAQGEITVLLEQEPASEMMSTLLENLNQAEIRPFSVCAAAYNVFYEYATSMHSYQLPSQIVVGRNHYPQGMLDDYPPDPELAGCNVIALLETLLASEQFSTIISPLEQLANLGVDVRESIEADLNADGVNEWIIWTTAFVPPVLFVPNGAYYSISRPTLRYIDDPHTEITVRSIASSGEQILADWVFYDGEPNNTRTYHRYQMQDECSRADGTGELTLWQMRDNHLEVILDMPLCESHPVDDLFQNGNQHIEGWIGSVFDQYGNAVQFSETIYRWNGELYVADFQSPATTTPQPEYISGIGYVTEESTEVAAYMTDGVLFDTLGQVETSLYEQNYEAALTILDNAISSADPAAHPIIVQGLHYFRALTLEQLDRDNEALAEYVTIYETAPNTSWGTLARLHFESSDQ